jgi:hypothetical protein
MKTDKTNVSILMVSNFRCVECSTPTPQIYVEYGKGNIRLVQCTNCSKFCDKYVEFDETILFIDMILLKPAAYRHVIHNRIEYDDSGLNVLVYNKERCCQNGSFVKLV